MSVVKILLIVVGFAACFGLGYMTAPDPDPLASQTIEGLEAQLRIERLIRTLAEGSAAMCKEATGWTLDRFPE